jgi:integrase
LPRLGDLATTERDRARRRPGLWAVIDGDLIASKDRQEFERKRAGSRWHEFGLVFTSMTGAALDARNLMREFKRHLAATKLPVSLRFHDMRHAAASLLMADGLPITLTSVMLGHASTTLNNYGPRLAGGG